MNQNQDHKTLEWKLKPKRLEALAKKAKVDMEELGIAMGLPSANWPVLLKECVSYTIQEWTLEKVAKMVGVKPQEFAEPIR